VYESCEALFAGLADEAKKYSDWLVLGDVAGELEEHVEAALCGDGRSSAAAGGDVGDWELNLRMLKTAAHDLNKLPNEVILFGTCCCSLINLIGYALCRLIHAKDLFSSSL
jgi:hypothetical protein